MVTLIPFVDMPKGAELCEVLPDGTYAQVDYDNGRVGLVRAPNPFPWTVMVFAFEDGKAHLVATGSSLSRMLTQHDVSKVFLVGLDQERHDELDATLENDGFSLVAV